MNTNILAGMKCPECGQADSFRIEMTGMGDVTDNGYDISFPEWTDDSYIECPSCNHDGIVASFREER